jgi:hypothetical protein
MVKKYVRHLENRDINPSTGSIWTINDVPNLWRTKVMVQIEADDYIIEEDGTVSPRPVNEDDKEVTENV